MSIKSNWFTTTMSLIGFIVIRHVNDAKTNLYWQEAVLNIRKFYPTNKLIIVDDNSNQEFVNDSLISEKKYDYNVVQSEFEKRGEILAYYYFHKLKPFPKAVVLHDSAFINSNIVFDDVHDVQFLWSFPLQWNNTALELEILSKFENKILLSTYNDPCKWRGCFGVMSVIEWEFLDNINTSYNFFNTLLPLVTCRIDRMAVERIFACACFSLKPSLIDAPHLIGDFEKCLVPPNNSFEGYKQGVYSHHQCIKIFTGR